MDHGAVSKVRTGEDVPLRRCGIVTTEDWQRGHCARRQGQIWTVVDAGGLEVGTRMVLFTKDRSYYLLTRLQ